MRSFQPRRDHLSLGEAMFAEVETAAFPKSILRYQNLAWASRLGLGDLLNNDEKWSDCFARFTPLEGSLPKPLALAYHGHQFGVYNPDIGDGRGVLYAQLKDPDDGRLLDLGTKGSGQTPYSRDGDGRLTLKGAVREILATEMLDALGVNTSKTFSVIETGENLIRHDEPSPTRSAVLVRLSHGHLRIGSFQRLAYQGDSEMLENVLRYSAQKYYPDELDSTAPVGALAKDFVEIIGIRLADLAAQWMAAGFVHGVLNTDNFNITGESFDYGPWRFIPNLEPRFTAAYFDHQGRYAYGRQPEASFWALCRLADCFVELSSLDAMQSSVGVFQDRMASAMVRAFCRRLGIDHGWQDSSRLIEALFEALRNQEIGFESVMFDWFGGEGAKKRALASTRKEVYQSSAFASALDLLTQAPTATEASLDHPYFNRPDPETMLIDEVEAIWASIAEADDWTLLRDKIAGIHDMAEAYDQNRFTPSVRISG